MLSQLSKGTGFSWGRPSRGLRWIIYFRLRLTWTRFSIGSAFSFRISLAHSFERGKRFFQRCLARVGEFARLRRLDPQCSDREWRSRGMFWIWNVVMSASCLVNVPLFHHSKSTLSDHLSGKMIGLKGRMNVSKIAVPQRARQFSRKTNPLFMHSPCAVSDRSSITRAV